MEEVVKPILQVHDELLFYCREDVKDEWGELVRDRFEHCAPLNVPIKAGTADAKDWGSLEK
jgi:DNA polymerase I-like protein with 3'-5' exonuclease and polymerase domains